MGSISFTAEIALAAIYIFVLRCGHLNGSRKLCRSNITLMQSKNDWTAACSRHRTYAVMLSSHVGTSSSGGRIVKLSGTTEATILAPGVIQANERLNRELHSYKHGQS